MSDHWPIGTYEGPRGADLWYGCVCGWPEGRNPDEGELRAHVFAAVLEDAADWFDQFDEVTIGETDIGSNMLPVEPAERLRNRAASIRAGEIS